MDLGLWLLLVITCIFGAMSPGPSLICVMQATLNSGTCHGTKVALAHGLGVLTWALFTVFAMNRVFEIAPSASRFIGVLGAAYLIYIGGRAINTARANNPMTINPHDAVQNRTIRVRDGFSIAFLNPKLAVFFTALFSQFLFYDPSVMEKLFMSLIAGFVDAIWYALIACFVGYHKVRSALLRYLSGINLVAGGLFILIGLNVVMVVLDV